MIEAVIFDMDGVLADTEYYYENRRKNFLLENGIPIPEGNFIGSNEKAIWEALVPNDPVRLCVSYATCVRLMMPV